MAGFYAQTYDRPRRRSHNCPLNGGQASQDRFDFLRSAGPVRADILRVSWLPIITVLGL